MSNIATEEFRPDTLEEVVGQTNVVERLKRYVGRSNIPHMLFSGPPGTGKTTCAIALVKDLFGESWKSNFMELNASDERGIDVVRTRVKNFAPVSSMHDSVSFKIIFLDEADNMTKDAQASLRRIMEEYSSTCRFIISCNYPNKIISPIQDRCAPFRFEPLSQEEIMDFLSHQSVEKYGYKFLDDSLEIAARACGGSLRRAVTYADMFSLTGGDVSPEEVRAALKEPSKDELRGLLTNVRNGNVSGWEDSLYDLYYGGGFSSMEILDSMYTMVQKEDISDNEKIACMVHIGNTDYYISEGATELIQLRCLFARLSNVFNKQ